MRKYSWRQTMKNKGFILLKTLLLATSQRNIYKYTTDKKKKRKIIGSTIGLFVLYALLMVYSIAMVAGFGAADLIKAAPLMCALIISGIAFIFTVFKTNGYLFNFREYDMLMSLPFEVKSVAACKFLYMYVKSLPWYLSISIAMMLGYGFFALPGIGALVTWFVLSFFLPVIPMLLASFIGFIIARISAGFRKNNIVQTVLSFVFVILCFSLRYIVEGIVKDDKVVAMMETTYDATRKAAGIYLPAMWFSDAITQGSVLSVLLLVGVTAALFAVVFAIVGKSYRNINSALKSHAAARNYKMTGQKKQSVTKAIAYKEFRRLLSSTTYTVNGALGEVLAALLGIVTLIFGYDRIVAIVTQNAPFDPALLQPAIPFIIYFFIGMMATTACSPSLEGKNYWIVQSLPITKKTLYQGKMLFNMYLSVPFMIFSTLCMCISARVPVINTILYIILGIVLCCFSTAWGCVCGIKHMRLDWENEVEVIKQGAAVSLYLLPNMFVTMALSVLVVVLGIFMDHRLIALIFILIAAALAALSYKRAIRLAERSF